MIRRILIISLACMLTAVVAAACHEHTWEMAPTGKRAVVGVDHYGLPIFSPDTVYGFKTYWAFRHDSTLAFIRCAECGEYRRVYGRRTTGAVWFDSLNAVIDSILTHK